MQLVCHLISTIGELERRTEVHRQFLAEQKSFEPYTAFRRLDRSRCGELFQQDIKDFMNENNYTISNIEACYLFRYLDQNHDGQVTYIDFVKQILPKENLKLREEAATRESYLIEINQKLTLEVEWGLFKILQQETLNFSIIEKIKTQLFKINIVNLKEVFKTIDQKNSGLITYKKFNKINKQNIYYYSLENFLLMNGHKTSREDLLAFFRTFNESCKLIFQEFYQTFQYFHPYQIIKDKERAYYSTPKKYRRTCDSSPQQHGSIYKSELNESTIYFSDQKKPNKFIFVTPHRPIQQNQPSTSDQTNSKQQYIQQELESDKQRLMLRSDFQLGKLYFQNKLKNISFKEFCYYILPTNPPNQDDLKITSQTVSLMQQIIGRELKNKQL